MQLSNNILCTFDEDTGKGKVIIVDPSGNVIADWETSDPDVFMGYSAMFAARSYQADGWRGEGLARRVKRVRKALGYAYP